MNKRHTLNLILFVFVIGLVSLVVFEPGKKTIPKPLSLTTLKPDDVRNIILKRGTDIAPIEFERNNNQWIMVKPYQLSANSFRINELLKLLSATSFSKNDISQLNPTKFGLTPPSATIRFNNIEMKFGHNKTLNNNRYLQVGSELHLMADIYYYKLAANTESFIDHRLLPENSNIQKIKLSENNFKLREGRWESNLKTFSADSLNQLINEWKSSQAYDVKVKAILKPIKPDVLITFNNKKTISFKVESNTKAFVLTNIKSGVQYFLSKDRKNKLLKLNPILEANIE